MPPIRKVAAEEFGCITPPTRERRHTWRDSEEVGSDGGPASPTRAWAQCVDAHDRRHEGGTPEAGAACGPE